MAGPSGPVCSCSNTFGGLNAVRSRQPQGARNRTLNPLQPPVPLWPAPHSIVKYRPPAHEAIVNLDKTQLYIDSWLGAPKASRLKSPGNLIVWKTSSCKNAGYNIRTRNRWTARSSHLGSCFVPSWPKQMSSGFAGVDVFFVISGYLNRDKILAGLRRNSLNGDLRTIHIH